VDDKPGIRFLLSNVLADVGYPILTAGDGRAALDLVDRQAFSLIVTYVQMPMLDGRGFCGALAERGNKFPVVVMSALNAAAVAREVGAVGHLDKPLTVFQARAIITGAIQAGGYRFLATVRETAVAS
jgi:CheY-like chemotaxis protein